MVFCLTFLNVIPFKNSNVFSKGIGVSKTIHFMLSKRDRLSRHLIFFFTMDAQASRTPSPLLRPDLEQPSYQIPFKFLSSFRLRTASTSTLPQPICPPTPATSPLPVQVSSHTTHTHMHTVTTLCCPFNNPRNFCWSKNTSYDSNGVGAGHGGTTIPCVHASHTHTRVDR